MKPMVPSAGPSLWPLSSEAVRKPGHQLPCNEAAGRDAQFLYSRVGKPPMPARNEVLESFEHPGNRDREHKDWDAVLGVAQAERSAQRGECSEPLKVGWSLGLRTQPNRRERHEYDRC